jgi:hypothetical protein
MVVQLAARPHITTGVALAAASVIAAGPATQHLPDFHVAQHLPQVSVSDINLTDAGSVMDLFSGVESELASLASGASAASVPATAATSFTVNPLQTWINTVSEAETNIQGLVNTWEKFPAPVLQQVLANGIQYVSDYVTPYQIAANGAVTYFASPSSVSGSFANQLTSATTAYNAGQIATAFNDLVEAVFTSPIVKIGEPLEATLQIPGFILQNLTNTTNFLTSTGIATVGNALTGLPVVASQGLGGSLQAIFDAQAAGDSVGVLTNFLDIPGQTTNAFLNGFTFNKVFDNGLLTSSLSRKGVPNGGLLQQLVTVLPRELAAEIVAPNAQNIGSGGSLAVGFQNLANQLTNGWPSLAPVSSLITSNLTSLLQNLPSIVSGIPSTLGNIAAVVGSFLINLLRML